MFNKIRLYQERKKFVEQKEPLITVYTPTYNRARILIDRAVRSVLNQTYKNFEYLIIDDGSTDNTKELVNKIKDPRIKYYYIPRSKDRGYPETPEVRWRVGAIIPSNFARKISRGQWIARLDDDDVWDSMFLEKMLHFAQQNNYEFVCCQNYETRNGITTIHKGSPANAYFKMCLNRETKIGAHSSFFHRTCLRFIEYNVNCYKKKWNTVDDTNLSSTFFKLGVKMGFLEEPLVIITPRPGESEIGLKAVLKAVLKYKNNGMTCFQP